MKPVLVWLPLVLSLCAQQTAAAAAGVRSFSIANDSFVKDGAPFRLLSGSIHYSRIHPALWQDRLSRMAAMGLNAIETYVPWNFHEETPGDFNFEGDRDFVSFLLTAQSVGLVVLLRPGPYICGEWDFGGFPSWLLSQSPPVTLRTYEPNYIAFVDRFWNALLPRVAPLLYSNGGPVVMMQIENEYGSYGDVSSNPADKQYMEHLLALARSHLGNDLVIYTTDGGAEWYMKRGTLPGQVYTVGDFGPGSDPTASFKAQKMFNAPGMSPNFCSEYYTGWLTHWNETMANTSSADVVTTLNQILTNAGSVNFYMAHGGTNFGWWSGANADGQTYQPHITSYDYDSPISEGGEHGYGSDHVDKFVAIQKALAPYAGKTPPEPPVTPKIAYPNLTLDSYASLLDSIKQLQPNCTYAQQPLPTMEELGQTHGFLLFGALVSGPGTMQLDAPGVRDRALVFVDGALQGIIYRSNPLPVKITVTPQSVLQLLVENMGHINYGSAIYDPKGILGAVTLDNVNITATWSVCQLPLDSNDLSRLSFLPTEVVTTPVFLRGYLTIDAGSVYDTYISTRGWRRGMIWVNGYHIGRYWDPIGPQHALYVPAPLLVDGVNEFIVLELEPDASTPQSLTFRDTADFTTSHAPVASPTHRAEML